MVTNISQKGLMQAEGGGVSHVPTVFLLYIPISSYIALILLFTSYNNNGDNIINILYVIPLPLAGKTGTSVEV